MAPQPQAAPPLSFREFLDSVRSAELPRPAAGAPRAAAVRVADEHNFQRMKEYLLRLYGGVDVHHSFVDESGQVFDCVPVHQQPSVRAAAPVATPPDLPAPGGTRARHDARPAPAQLQPGRKDQHGNDMTCPPGTVPVRRVTLQELMRFETLDQFFRKSPLGRGGHPRLTATQATAVHKYAHAYQVVNNIGGHSYVNIWQPPIGGNQIFSLSQHWYSGGSGASLQTVEVGWQVYPQKYGTANPVLFIYWTADGYQTTGNYNLDAPAFVQTNPSWLIGGSIGPASTPGGPQYELEISWFLYQGNWWLYIGGTDSAHTVGYYPTSLFRGGQLASYANAIDYGGETVGEGSWPPMGSGAFANAGYQRAATHRDIYCFLASGGVQQASLTPQQLSPACYTIDVETAPAPWNSYFYFGGPGGTGC